MLLHRSAIVLALAMPFVVPMTPARGGEEDVAQLLSRIPADYPVTIVLSDFAKLDRMIATWRKRLHTHDAGESWIDKLKSELPIGEWVDFSKPIGVAIPQVMGKWEGLLFLRVPDLTEKLKTLEGAAETEGVWEIPHGESDRAYLTVAGDNAIFSSDKMLLIQAAAAKTFLLNQVKPRMKMIAGRDLFLHLNVEPLRAIALGAIAQVSQAAPILMMAAAQQGNTAAAPDPALMMASVNTLIDSVKQFVQQVGFIDIVGSLDENNARLTLAAGFLDGPIRNYLTSRKPAGRTLFGTIERQPYMMAMGYDIPGDDSPFYDYFFGKALEALPPLPLPTPSPEGQDAEAAGAAAAEAAKAVTKSFETSRDMYRRLNGVDGLATFGPHGIRALADYFARDPKALFELAKESMTQANSFMTKLGGAGTLEALGDSSIEGTMVEQYALKMDAANPATAMAISLIGQSTRMALGQVGSNVRFGMGNDAYLRQTFRKVQNPLASAPHVRDALAALPARRNGVVLLDIAGAIATLKPIIGGETPAPEAPAPGPPIAASFSLSEDPARVDIHIPLPALEGIMQAIRGGGDDSM